MISNPNPEHGPLWVEWNPAWPHDGPAAFLCWLGYRLWLDAEQADAIEAQITQLPDGVYRDGKGDLWLAAQFPVPVGGQVQTDGHGWMGRMGNIPASHSNRRFRRIPAEPPAPPTEDVPWWESVGRKLGKGPERGNVIRRCGKNGNHAWINTHRDRDATDVPDGVNPDGTVTVQRETETDGAS